MVSHRHFEGDIPAYLAGRLSDEHRVDLEAHLAECEPCSGLVLTWLAILEAVEPGDTAPPAPLSQGNATRPGTRGEIG